MSRRPCPEGTTRIKRTEGNEHLEGRRRDAATLPEYQKYLADNPNAKVTFDQMQYVRTQGAKR